MRTFMVRIAVLAIASFMLPLSLVHAQAKEETSTVKVETSRPRRRNPKNSSRNNRRPRVRSPSAATRSITTPLRARWSCMPRVGTMSRKMPTLIPRTRLRKPACSTLHISNQTRGYQHILTFLFNGGPGSSSVWLHMGAFGPKRVVTADDTHTAAAPYSVVNNEYSLLDVSDLVFVDAPGTGFSRLSGKDKEKAFYGVDQDAFAFSDFIVQFLSKYGRWNSPKYLFGESYGTTRSAVLSNLLETERDVDFNGVILLSQGILEFLPRF